MVPLGKLHLAKLSKPLEGGDINCKLLSRQLVRVLVETLLGNKACVAKLTPQQTHSSSGVRAAAQRLLFHNPANQTSPKSDVLVVIEVVGGTEEGRYMTMKAMELVRYL